MCDHWNVPAFRYDPEGGYTKTLPRCVAPFLTKKVNWVPLDHCQAGYHSSDLFADTSVRYLNERDTSNPFFLYVSFMAPHAPRVMPRKFRDLYDEESLRLPANFMGAHPFDNGELRIRDEKLEDWPRTPEAIREHMADYYAMFTHLDDCIGRVVQTLKETGEYDNTIILMAGDNGLAVGRHGLMGKQNLYEHSVRVPLILAGPGVPKGERRDAFCYLLDIFPTLCGLAGVTVPDTVEGLDLRPLLDSADASVRDDLLLAYCDVQRGVRERKWKLIEYCVNGRRTTQLFDVEEDPHELHNRADDPGCAEHLERLRGKLLRWRDELDDASCAFWETFAKT